MALSTMSASTEDLSHPEIKQERQDSSDYEQTKQNDESEMDLRIGSVFSLNAHPDQNRNQSKKEGKDSFAAQYKKYSCKKFSVVLENIDDYLMGRNKVLYRQWKRRFQRCGQMCRQNFLELKYKKEKQRRIARKEEEMFGKGKHLVNMYFDRNNFDWRLHFSDGSFEYLAPKKHSDWRREVLIENVSPLEKNDTVPTCSYGTLSEKLRQIKERYVADLNLSETYSKDSIKEKNMKKVIEDRCEVRPLAEKHHKSGSVGSMPSMRQIATVTPRVSNTFMMKTTGVEAGVQPNSAQIDASGLAQFPKMMAGKGDKPQRYIYSTINGKQILIPISDNPVIASNTVQTNPGLVLGVTNEDKGLGMLKSTFTKGTEVNLAQSSQQTTFLPFQDKTGVQTKSLLSIPSSETSSQRDIQNKNLTTLPQYLYFPSQVTTNINNAVGKQQTLSNKDVVISPPGNTAILGSQNIKVQSAPTVQTSATTQNVQTNNNVLYPPGTIFVVDNSGKLTLKNNNPPVTVQTHSTNQALLGHDSSDPISSLLPSTNTVPLSSQERISTLKFPPSLYQDANKRVETSATNTKTKTESAKTSLLPQTATAPGKPPAPTQNFNLMSTPDGKFVLIPQQVASTTPVLNAGQTLIPQQNSNVATAIGLNSIAQPNANLTASVGLGQNAQVLTNFVQIPRPVLQSPQPPLPQPQLVQLSSGQLVMIQPTAPSVQNATIPTVQNATIPSVLNTTTPTVQNATIPSVQNTTIPTVLHAAIPSVKNTVPTVQNTTIPSVQNSTIPSVQNTTIPTVLNAAIPSVKNTVPTVQNTPIPSVQNSTIPSVQNATIPAKTSILNILQSQQMAGVPSTLIPIFQSPSDLNAVQNLKTVSINDTNKILSSNTPVPPKAQKSALKAKRKNKVKFENPQLSQNPSLVQPSDGQLLIPTNGNTKYLIQSAASGTRLTSRQPTAAQLIDQMSKKKQGSVAQSPATVGLPAAMPESRTAWAPVVNLNSYVQMIFEKNKPSVVSQKNPILSQKLGNSVPTGTSGFTSQDTPRTVLIKQEVQDDCYISGIEYAMSNDHVTLTNNTSSVPHLSNSGKGNSASQIAGIVPRKQPTLNSGTSSKRRNRRKQAYINRIDPDDPEYEHDASTYPESESVQPEPSIRKKRKPEKVYRIDPDEIRETFNENPSDSRSNSPEMDYSVFRVPKQSVVDFRVLNSTVEEKGLRLPDNLCP